MKSSLRLLLIEDSEDDAFLLLHPIRRAGYQLTVKRVETLEAMQLALQSETWDVVIADYLLPSFTARDALKLLQSLDLDIPFIVVSGAMGEETAVAIMRMGAHDYLLKESLSRLVPAIERELREAEVRQQKRQAEAALRQAYEGLETLVAQRTAELQVANDSLKQLAAIVESSNDAIISTTPDGIVLSWNRGAEKIYGYSSEEAKGQVLEALVNPSRDTLESQLAQNQQVIHQRKDGSLIDIFLTVSSMETAIGGKSWIARDITELRAVERMKDEFVSIVSHELRTPLTSIRASLGLLILGKLGVLPEASQPFLDIAVKNTDRLIRLINDILSLERLNSGKITLTLHPCSLAELMVQAIDTLQGIAYEAQIQLQVTPLACQVLADPDRILQALTNLLSNAIKFSTPGTVVTLNAENRGAEVCVAIQDHGRGIPADKLETIFERFQQVDASDSRQHGGTGLGLSICQSIIEHHQGRIWVESILGLGSTFFFTLPTSNQLE